jgi:hypothetical protein
MVRDRGAVFGYDLPHSGSPCLFIDMESITQRHHVSFKLYSPSHLAASIRATHIVGP